MKAKFKVGDKVRLNPNMNYELINLATICQYHKLGIIYTVVTSKIDCGVGERIRRISLKENLLIR